MNIKDMWIMKAIQKGRRGNHKLLIYQDLRSKSKHLPLVHAAIFN
jgi:hypothetical protein